MKKRCGRTWKNIRYWLFFCYLGWMHDKILYRRTYLVNKKNIPPIGVPLVIVSNHQNALNDPLAIEFAFRNRIVSIFARGDIFANKFAGSFLKSLYILPAYRMKVDGIDSVSKNYESFDEAHERLLTGGSVAIFPEGTNQDKRWLGDFSQGYLRMAFGAAEKSGFTKDIVILPTANHYSNYFHMQSDMLISCGTPISLMPYYELYKQKPRTAQREVNRLVRAQVSDLMLNITDLEHYDVIDYLRISYGIVFAKNKGYNPNKLPEKLDADKRLVLALDELKSSHSAEIMKIYSDVEKLRDVTKHFDIRDWNFDVKFSLFRYLFFALLFLLLFPIFLFALIPNVAAFFAPKRIVNKFNQMGGAFRMFAGGIQFALNSVLVLPILYIGVFVADWLLFNWLVALIHLLILPWLGVFAWYYRIYFIKWKSVWRFRKASTHPDVIEAIAIRKRVWIALDRLLSCC